TGQTGSMMNEWRACADPDFRPVSDRRHGCAPTVGPSPVDCYRQLQGPVMSVLTNPPTSRAAGNGRFGRNGSRWSPSDDAQTEGSTGSCTGAAKRQEAAGRRQTLARARPLQMTESCRLESRRLNVLPLAAAPPRFENRGYPRVYEILARKMARL